MSIRPRRSAPNTSISRKPTWRSCAGPAMTGSSPRWRRGFPAMCWTISPPTILIARPYRQEICVFTFPAIDPVALELGPIVIRWYALAYIVGLIGGWRYALLLARREPVRFEPRLLDDFVVWATLGVVIGGRLGYVLFYRPDYYLADPLQILMVWRGGMAFHGGMLG